MRKKKLLMILVLCLGMVGWTSAVEVINIDFNNYGDDTAYTGEGAYVDGGTQWIVYSGGWGVAVGSPRSAGLVDQGTVAAGQTEPGYTLASTYAAQVWIGDPGGNHDYFGSGDTLLGDGFVKNGTADPNIAFFGEGAYGGNFDMYIYGNSAGTFTIADGNDILGTASVTGTVSGFVEGENYVVFHDVPLGNPNMIRLYYTGELNGVQLVSTKQPVAVSSAGTQIDARNYDVAFDTNARDGEITYYGPDIATHVHYLDNGEYMSYDITVDAANAGQYELSADFVAYWGAAGMDLYLDDNLYLGELALEQHADDPNALPSDNTLTVNLFEGTHTLKWQNTELYFDVVQLNLNYLAAINLTDCSDVYLYGLQPIGDVNADCRVDLSDMQAIVEDWLVNYDPQAQ